MTTIEEKQKITPNEKQKQAIETIDGTVMVLAGPGTGKTFTIIERIKYMLSRGISPDKILCMTFSEAAANEMKVRLQNEVGEPALSLKIDTYHAFCAEIIKDYPSEFSMKEDFSIVDDINKYYLMKEVLTEYNPKYYRSKLGDIYLDIDNLLKNVGRIKKSLVTKDEYFNIIEKNYLWKKSLNSLLKKKQEEDAIGKPLKKTEGAIKTLQNRLDKANEMWDIYELYSKKLRDNNFIDFDDMIIFVLEKFQKDPLFLTNIAQNWDYIFVDEYQDTNKAQNHLVFSLEKGRGLGNLFVVGDDDQLIFAFQGAELNTIENFLDLYPDTKVICLDENNRSTQTILDFSYKVISQDEQRLESKTKFASKNISKKLTAKNQSICEKDRKIQLHQFYDIKQENNFIIDEIKRIINSNEIPTNKKGEPDLSQIAILASSNAELTEFAQLLKNNGIDFQMRDTKSIFKIQSSLLTYFYLKTLENKSFYQDKLFSILRQQPFSFEPEDYSYLISLTNKNNKKDFITIMKENLDYTWKNPQKIKSFLDTYDELIKIKDGTNIKEILLAIMNKTGILPYFASSPINRYENIMALKKLIEQADAFSKHKKTFSLSDFINYLDKADEDGFQIKIDEDLFTKNAVQLLTMHSSKGREFEIVFIVNLTSQKWESSSQKASDDLSLPLKDYPEIFDNEEELKKSIKKTEHLKKLFVAITRAKYGLYLTYSCQNGKRSQKLTSYISNAITPEMIDDIQHTLDSNGNIEEVIKSLSQNKIDYDLSMRKVIEQRLENFVLSASTLNTYLNCPKEFFYSNVLKIPANETSNSNASFGSVIHNVFEWACSNNTYPTLDEMKSKFITEISKKAFPSQKEREIFEERGLKCLDLFYNDFVSLPIENIYKTEEDISSSIDGYKLYGRIDRIQKNEDGTYSVYDYKTGDGTTKTGGIKSGGVNEKYYNQLRFYKLIFELKNPDKKVSQTYLIYPETQTVIEKIFDDEEMADIKDKIINTYQSIQNLDFEIGEKSENKCKYCAYRQTCEWNN